MNKQSKNTRPPQADNISDEDEALTLLAETYLDFWQENVKCWATDPQSLEKWMDEASRHLKSDKNTPPD